MMTEYIDREAVKEIMQKYRCSDCTNDKSLDCPLCQLHRPFAEISKNPQPMLYKIASTAVWKSLLTNLNKKQKDI